MPTNTKPRVVTYCQQFEPPQEGKFLDAFTSFYTSKIKAPSIQDMVLGVDADMPTLYRLIANTQTKTGIESARKIVNKWLRGVNNPSKKYQQRFKDLQLSGKVNIPYDKGLSVTVRGCFRISDTYGRAKNGHISVSPDEVQEYLQKSLNSDAQAVSVFNEYYRLDAIWLSNTTVSIDFE